MKGEIGVFCKNIKQGSKDWNENRVKNIGE
jgi:hypothetical protein